MSKIKLFSRVFALITAGITVCSVQSFNKDEKSDDSIQTSIVVEKDYEIIKTKESLSNDLMELINQYDIGLVDYINQFTDFSSGYKPYDEINDVCPYFTNLDINQRNIIYDFAYSYYEYLKCYKNNDIEGIRKFIVRMINKSREFGSTTCALSETLSNNLDTKDYDLEAFSIDNVLPLIESVDYNDYIALLYKYNNNISKKQLSINSINGDILDKEIANFILYIHLNAKYNLKPLYVIKSDYNYLANEDDINNYILNTNLDINNKVLNNFSLKSKYNRWVLVLDNNVFKVLNNNSLILYLDNLSEQYNKDIFSYSDMLELGLIKMIFNDEEVSEYSDVEEYWWPIGSRDVEVIDGVEFAKGYPEETFIVNGYDYINGRNGYGVTNIIASKSGLVIYPTEEEQILYNHGDNKYGNYVIIKHFDDCYTGYYHLSFDSITVMSGDYVTQGQVIGKMGNTGYAMDNYLEFKIFDNDMNNELNIFDCISQDEPRKVKIYKK